MRRCVAALGSSPGLPLSLAPLWSKSSCSPMGFVEVAFEPSGAFKLWGRIAGVHDLGESAAQKLLDAFEQELEERGQIELVAGAMIAVDGEAVLVVFLIDDLDWAEDLSLGVANIMKDFTAQPTINAGLAAVSPSPIVGVI